MRRAVVPTRDFWTVIFDIRVAKAEISDKAPIAGNIQYLDNLNGVEKLRPSDHWRSIANGLATAASGCPNITTIQTIVGKAPEILLAAIGAKTERMRIGSTGITSQR